MFVHVLVYPLSHKIHYRSNYLSINLSVRSIMPFNEVWVGMEFYIHYNIVSPLCSWGIIPGIRRHLVVCYHYISELWCFPVRPSGIWHSDPARLEIESNIFANFFCHVKIILFSLLAQPPQIKIFRSIEKKEILSKVYFI